MLRRGIGRLGLLNASLSVECISGNGGSFLKWNKSTSISTEEAVARADPTYIEPDLPCFEGEMRSGTGTRFSVRMRQAGRIPAILSSLPDEEKLLISLDKKNVEKEIFHYGGIDFFLSRVYCLKLKEGDKEQSYRVLPKVVHIAPDTQAAENVSFIHCPRTRKVKVPVPLEMVGHDKSPGIKRGGYPIYVMWTVELLCDGANIPELIHVDISHLDLGKHIRAKELNMPRGCSWAKRMDPNEVLIKLTRK